MSMWRTCFAIAIALCLLSVDAAKKKKNTSKPITGGWPKAFEGDLLNCDSCIALQEAIHHSIVANISSFEKRTLAGGTDQATIQIGQIIWWIMDSDAWRRMRMSDAQHEEAKEMMKSNVEEWTKLWQEHNNEWYKDVSKVYGQKQQLCTPICQDSTKEQLLDQEVNAHEDCDMCKMIVKDMNMNLRRFKDRPDTAGSDAYFRLRDVVGDVCKELPMRHRLKSNSNAVLACEDLWEEHETALLDMIFSWKEGIGQQLCVNKLSVCSKKAYGTVKDEL